MNVSQSQTLLDVVATHPSKSSAARSLGISPQTLAYRLKKAQETVEAAAKQANYDKAMRLVSKLLTLEKKEQLTDYDRAKMYRQLVDSKAFTSQREIAEKIGIHSTQFSLRLNMLKLPGEVLALLEKNPALITSTHALYLRSMFSIRGYSKENVLNAMLLELKNQRVGDSVPDMFSRIEQRLDQGLLVDIPQVNIAASEIDDVSLVEKEKISELDTAGLRAKKSSQELSVNALEQTHQMIEQTFDLLTKLTGAYSQILQQVGRSISLV